MGPAPDLSPATDAVRIMLPLESSFFLQPSVYDIAPMDPHCAPSSLLERRI